MTRPTKRPRGRPVTTERGQESRTRVTVSLSPDEARTLERAAGGAGQTVAAWIREQAIRAAEGT